MRHLVLRAAESLALSLLLVILVHLGTMALSGAGVFARLR